MQKSERQCAELQKRSQAVLSRTFDQQEVNTFEQIVQEKNHFAKNMVLLCNAIEYECQQNGLTPKKMCI